MNFARALLVAWSVLGAPALADSFMPKLDPCSPDAAANALITAEALKAAQAVFPAVKQARPCLGRLSETRVGFEPVEVVVSGLTFTISFEATGPGPLGNQPRVWTLEPFANRAALERLAKRLKADAAISAVGARGLRCTVSDVRAFECTSDDASFEFFEPTSKDKRCGCPALALARLELPQHRVTARTPGWCWLAPGSPLRALDAEARHTGTLELTWAGGWTVALTANQQQLSESFDAKVDAACDCQSLPPCPRAKR